jgi:hypothetical protein
VNGLPLYIIRLRLPRETYKKETPFTPFTPFSPFRLLAETKDLAEKSEKGHFENDRCPHLGPVGFRAHREPGRMASFAGAAGARRRTEVGARELRAHHGGTEASDERELVNAARFKRTSRPAAAVPAPSRGRYPEPAERMLSHRAARED